MRNNTKSRYIIGSIPGRCTLTATVSPLAFNFALYTWPKLAEAIGVGADDLWIFQSRGGSSVEILHQNNVSDEELSKEISFVEFEGEEKTTITLMQAMSDGRDDHIQNHFDYSWEDDEYYQAPLTVVEVK